MKIRIFILCTFLLLCMGRSNAQRISTFSLDGLTSLAPCCSFTPTNNDESAPGDLQIVFPPDTDLSNRVATLGGTFTIDTNPMPTDWRSTQTIQLTNGNNTAWYDISCKVIQPSSLPFLMNTSVSYIAEAWSSTTTQGWAASCIQREKDHVRFGNAYANFLVAFTDTPDSVSYSIYFAADVAADGTVFDVEESADGVTWSNVMQWTETNIPTNLSTDEEKYHAHKLLPSSRFVRWYFSTRTSGTISIVDMLKVTSAEEASSNQEVKLATNTSATSEVVLAPMPAVDRLFIKATQDIASVVICNITGQPIAIHNKVDSEVAVSALTSGSYLAIITFCDGSKTTKLFVKQ